MRVRAGRIWGFADARLKFTLSLIISTELDVSVETAKLAPDSRLIRRAELLQSVTRQTKFSPNPRIKTYISSR